MKTRIYIVLAATIFAGAASINTFATISSIKSDKCPNPACLPNVTQPVVRGVSSSKASTMQIFGSFVDTSTAVEVSGSGVSVSYGDRNPGNNSSIVVRFSVSPSAALGERTVKMRYFVETNGPDTFKIKVVRGGQVTDIKRVVFSGDKSSATRNYLEPTAIPVDEPVILRFSGRSIGNAKIHPNSNIANIEKVSCTEDVCEFRLTFKTTGNLNLNLLDIGVGSSASSTVFRFFYSGDESVTVAGTASTSPTLTPVNPPSFGGTAPPATFVDSAPRANMINIFRSRSVSFIDATGKKFFAIGLPENLCSGMTGTASRLVTIPDPVWGVSNVGTANITANFQIQLRSGAATLDTQLITTDLLPGATRDFKFDRPGDSQVRVHTFLDRGGCFISPQADKYFEDPSYTVVVDTTGALAETIQRRSNNSRNY
ncbi:MAG: hypothetical protein WBD22_14955 [Pyrinomonadaceae bacterium]